MNTNQENEPRMNTDEHGWKEVSCNGKLYRVVNPDWSALADAWVHPDFVFAQVKA
jgi:hypothetical protein